MKSRQIVLLLLNILHNIHMTYRSTEAIIFYSFMLTHFLLPIGFERCI